MILNSRRLAIQATKKALQIRKTAEISPFDPVSIFDLVDRMNVELRITDIPSMEGIYLLGERPTIILSSLRPKGRQAFTCAHELGHHLFGHGEKFDELIEQSKTGRRQDPDEFVADSFAGMLLMPRTVVIRAFQDRNQLPETASSEIFYSVATFLGVGYSTLITHMYYALKMITRNRLEVLLKVQVSNIRKDIFGKECCENLFIVDANWNGRAIDLECSDLCVLPPSFKVESDHLNIVEQNNYRIVVQANSPGLGRLQDTSSEWSSFVRVAKKGFTGRAKFRFQEDE